MDRGDPLILNEFCKIARVLMSAGVGHDQSCSVRQWPEELPNGDVEAEWGLLQDAVVCAKLIFVLHPTEAVDDGGMRVQCAFGSAGGP
jgi:hypothetical protein